MIVATFPAGVDQITVNGLYQWDYGQTLEIHSSDLKNKVLEVHFACAGMNEAVVRSCNAVAGVVSAVIPDICMEQTKPIAAWVYEVGQTSGKTLKTVTLPVIARTRPEPSASIPATVSDKYTQAIAAMNAAVAAIEEGSVTARFARNAEYSDKVLEYIGAELITDIFESNNKTVKRATSAASADEADYAAIASEAYELCSTVHRYSGTVAANGTTDISITGGAAGGDIGIITWEFSTDGSTFSSAIGIFILISSTTGYTVKDFSSELALFVSETGVKVRNKSSGVTVRNVDVRIIIRA